MTQQQIIEQEAESKFPYCYAGVDNADVNKDSRDGFIDGANFALGLSRWVKVEDGLPEREPKVNFLSCDVLVTNGEVTILSYYNYTTQRWEIDEEPGIDPNFITHWQPLPAPPTGK